MRAHVDDDPIVAVLFPFREVPLDDEIRVSVDDREIMARGLGSKHHVLELHGHTVYGRM